MFQKLCSELDVKELHPNDFLTKYKHKNEKAPAERKIDFFAVKKSLLSDQKLI